MKQHMTTPPKLDIGAKENRRFNSAEMLRGTIIFAIIF
jgi:hypothetical protein